MPGEKRSGLWSTVVRFLLHRRSFEHDLNEEMESHIAECAHQLATQGLTHEEALRRARLEFGSYQKYKEECRDSIGVRLFGELAADFRYTLRTMRLSAFHTALLVLCLALGIGITTAIFSVTDAVLFKPLPVSAARQLLTLFWDNKREVPDEIRSFGTGYGAYCFPYNTYEKLRAEAGTLRRSGITHTFAYAPLGFETPNTRVVIRRVPFMASGELVTSDYFDALGVSALIGRTIRPADFLASAPPVAVISYRYWFTRFAGDSSAVGSTVDLNGVPATIVGVAARGFFGMNPETPADLWVPMRGDRALWPWGAPPAPGQTLSSARTWWWLPLFVRHQPGTTDKREMSIRLATGASRPRIIRQMITESIVLSLIAAALGTALAYITGPALVLLVCGRNAALNLDGKPDGRVLLFSLALSVATGILFGFAPALRASQSDISLALKKQSRSVSGGLGLSQALLVGQVAFSLLLLVACGLFLQTFRNLHNQNLGFNARNLLLFSLDARGDGYSGTRLLSFYGELLKKTNSVPGVRSASVSSFALMSGWSSDGTISTDAQPLRPGQSNQVFWNSIGPDYVKTMGMQLMLGRDLTDRDIDAERRFAVVNESLAQRYFKGLSPLGHHFNTGNRDPNTDWEIVGVTKDAKYGDARSEAPPTAYLSFAAGDIQGLGRMEFAVRTLGDPAGAVPSIRKAIQTLDDQLPMVQVTTQADLLDSSLQQENVFAKLSAAFAAVALVLAALGLYGNLSYAVNRRVNEIGIRVALGARNSTVIWLILKTFLSIVSAGLLIGSVASAFSTRLIASTLYGVRPTDGITMAAAAALLLVTGICAALVPAFRASRVDPLVALRYE